MYYVNYILAAVTYKFLSVTQITCYSLMLLRTKQIGIFVQVSRIF